jgi:hypothetical protein
VVRDGVHNGTPASLMRASIYTYGSTAAADHYR